MKKAKDDALALRKAVGDRIRVERARRRISQEDLAHASGLSRVYVGAVERGEAACTLTVLARIARAMELPARELLPEG